MRMKSAALRARAARRLAMRVVSAVAALSLAAAQLPGIEAAPCVAQKAGSGRCSCCAHESAGEKCSCGCCDGTGASPKKEKKPGIPSKSGPTRPCKCSYARLGHMPALMPQEPQELQDENVVGELPRESRALDICVGVLSYRSRAPPSTAKGECL